MSQNSGTWKIPTSKIQIVDEQSYLNHVEWCLENKIMQKPYEKHPNWPPIDEFKS